MSSARTKLLLLALVASGCEGSAAGDEPRQAPPAPVRLENPAKVKFHMRRGVDDLKEVQRLLVAGKLEDAKTRAFLLTKPVKDPGLEQYFGLSSQLADAAQALVEAPDLNEALRREARVALACANCHASVQKLVVFPPPPAMPPGLLTRHQWAADRLWEGMIAGSLVPWRAGLEVLAKSPMPPSTQPRAGKLADRMHLVATDALIHLEDQSETLEGRAKAYGEILVTCAGCHATPQPGPRAAARP